MKRSAAFTVVLLLAFSLSPGLLPAAEIAGVTLDETIRIGDRTAKLTGMGLRTKTFLKIKVYVAGLYMEKPALDAAEIIGSDQAKAVVMHFLYKEVDGEKLQESWREGFSANTPGAGPDLAKRMDRFVSMFKAPALEGDRYVFAYKPGRGTSVTLANEVKAVIPGADFSRALMAVWFGENPGDGGLKALKRSVLEGVE